MKYMIRHMATKDTKLTMPTLKPSCKAGKTN